MKNSMISTGAIVLGVLALLVGLLLLTNIFGTHHEGIASFSEGSAG